MFPRRVFEQKLKHDYGDQSSWCKGEEEGSYFFIQIYLLFENLRFEMKYEIQYAYNFFFCVRVRYTTGMPPEDRKVRTRPRGTHFCTRNLAVVDHTHTHTYK